MRVFVGFPTKQIKVYSLVTQHSNINSNRTQYNLSFKINVPVVSMYTINTLKTVANDRRHAATGSICRNGDGPCW